METITITKLPNGTLAKVKKKALSEGFKKENGQAHQTNFLVSLIVEDVKKFTVYKMNFTF